MSEAVISNLIIIVPLFIILVGVAIRAIRSEIQKYKDTLPAALQKEIKPVEDKVDHLLISDKYQLFFDEGKFPMLIIDTSSSKIVSANVAFCKMVGETKETVEKERFLKYISESGIVSAREILATMRDGSEINGKTIDFHGTEGQLYSTGNGNIYINIIPDKKVNN